MILSVLSDNSAGSGYLAEHGLSFFIETEKENILFDTGQSDVFIQNAKKLGLFIENVNTVVLSHGHYDHGNGLEFLNDKKLICHPEIFIKRYKRSSNKNIGISLNKGQIKKKFKLITSKNPFMISNDVLFLGEIPRTNDFESKTTEFIKEDGSDDFVNDDSALAVRTKNGLVIISGCGHSGICNIIEYAKKIMSEKKVFGIIGGFHLKLNDEITQKTIEFIKNAGIIQIHPSHCIELPALSAFYKEFKIKQLKTGDVIKFE